MLDAKNMGSVARFANHSCEPNCELQKWSVLGNCRVRFAAIEIMLYHIRDAVSQGRRDYPFIDTIVRGCHISSNNYHFMHSIHCDVMCLTRLNISTQYRRVLHRPRIKESHKSWRRAHIQLSIL